MKESFCWEHKGCSKPCPVKESQSLFCWRVARASGFQSPETCGLCDYRMMWMTHRYSLAGFVRARDRRSPARSRRKRVLVVDDEPNILYALEESVKAIGYDCLGAPDGEEALFLARETAPDLIITDIVMPKINGFELCRAVKREEVTAGIPVIVVTVRGMMKDVREGERSGADAYIVKPFHAWDLEKTIRSMLGSAGGSG